MSVKLRPKWGIRAEMSGVVEDAHFRSGAENAGPNFVVSNGFTWPRVVDKLIDLMFPD